MNKRAKSYAAAIAASKATASVEVVRARVEEVRSRNAKMDAFARHAATSPRFAFEAAAQAVSNAVARAKSHA